MSFSSIPPGAWLGLLGGGQLGRMFAMAAQSLGFRVAVLDPDPEAPAAAVADLHIVADYDEPAALERLAGLCAAVTTEFENVPARSLTWLEEHVRVSPRAPSVAIAQDRVLEKRFIVSCGLSVTPHVVVEAESDLAGIDPGFWPAILKVARLGYDGKGQMRVANEAGALAAFRELGCVTSVLEKRLDLALELSVVVARGSDGRAATYPVAQNIHRDGILAISTVPAPDLSPGLRDEALGAALRIAEDLDYVGVLCVEFFVLTDGSLVVNEMAPRPHNSGHYSIDACVTSQFEQQVRVLAGLPLGSTGQHSAAIMLNLLGDLWFRPSLTAKTAAPDPSDGAVSTAPPQEPDWPAVLGHTGAKLHLYGKREARAGRKMGHVTIVATAAAAAFSEARAVAALLDIALW